MADVSTQTVKPVTCRCGEDIQKLDEVLDGLNHLQDELCTRSCDILDVHNRCLLIEKHMDCMVHSSTSGSSSTPLPGPCYNSQLTTPARRSPTHTFQQDPPLHDSRQPSDCPEPFNNSELTTPARNSPPPQQKPLSQGASNNSELTTPSRNSPPPQQNPLSHGASNNSELTTPARHSPPTQENPLSQGAQRPSDHPASSNNSQLTTPARHPPTSQLHQVAQPIQQESIPKFPDAEKLVSVRIQSSSRRNFAKNVAVLAFSKQERMSSNVKGVQGKKQLSPNRIERIKQIVFNHFPLETGEESEKAWSSCRRAIDENARKLIQNEKK